MRCVGALLYRRQSRGVRIDGLQLKDALDIEGCLWGPKGTDYKTSDAIFAGGMAYGIIVGSYAMPYKSGILEGLRSWELLPK